MLVGVTAGVEFCQGGVDVAAFDQAALGEPGVHLDAEARERGADRVDHQLDPARADRLEVVGVDPLGGDRLPQLGHVVALVTVLG